MRAFAFWIAALLPAQAALAETVVLDTSQSLVTLEAGFSAKADRSPAEDLALASVVFLRSVERSLQTRYRSNAGIGPSLIDIPVLRLPFEPNPAPEPFEAGVIAEIFRAFDGDMERVREVLADTTMRAEDIVEIDISEIWFDVNSNGARDRYEGMLDVAGAMLVGAFRGQEQTDLPKLPVHFDAADAEWLLAYTHMLSGFSQIVLAFDPTEVITEVLESAEAMERVKGPIPPTEFSYLRGEEGFIDTFAIVYGALNRPPDKDRIAEAHAHLLQMIQRNRGFWQLVAAETDNSLEWIPNRNQQAALGFELPDDTQARWLAVLSDAEAVLKGELLVSHWRVVPGGGINVAKLVRDPPAVDIVTWIQGSGLVPFMEQGQVVSGESFRSFSAMFQGDALLFMVLLN
ncbi:MAG: hypothetical protein HKN63_06485 [Rhodobacteraceae bacterium]|nr:hypothetical protein [Paracoccaceae bacterium]